jgi:hypothetical protein
MIYAEVIRVWRGLDLESSKEDARVTLRLPGGLEVDALIPPDYLSVLTEAAAKASNPPVPHEEVLEERGEHTPEPEKPPTPQLVTWGEMPEELLPNPVKYAMKDLDLQELLPLENILQIRDAILTEYTDDDWNKLANKYFPSTQDAPAPRSVSAPASIPTPPTRPAVEWGEGTVMRPSRPARTVPSDEAGNPIAPRVSGADVGEVSPKVSDDDDGVGEF